MRQQPVFYFLEFVLLCAGMLLGRPALAQAAGNASSAPQTVPAEEAADNTMKFQFVDTPIESILNAISARLGIEIDRAQPVAGRVTIIVPQPVDADEAMRLLNAILAPARCTSILIERQNADGTPRPAVRVGTIDEAKKGAIPVD